MKSKFILVALALMCLIGSISAVSAAQITKVGEGRDPALYDSTVVWSDNAGSIHIYDLAAKKDTKINSASSSYPAIYGNKVVWHDESSGASRLTVYDVKTAARSYIVKDVDSSSIPAIYGTRIVWSANSTVYMRDISQSTQTKIASGENPDIYDTKITYSYDDGDMPRIYVYDVITKKTTLISSYGYLSQSHIYGNKVIWSDFYTRLGYISMYDIATQKVTTVTSDGSTCDDGSESGCDTGTHTDINGDKIVYAKSSDDCIGSAGVYVYSISAAQSTQIFSSGNGVLTTPDIYGNTIVWGIVGNVGNVGETNNNDIYMCNLPTKPTADFSANKISGKAPLSVQFTSKTTGNPTDYYWVFEPSTSSDWNSHHTVTAVHTFKKPGVYTVSLTVTNGAGSATVTKKNYITVK